MYFYCVTVTSRTTAKLPGDAIKSLMRRLTYHFLNLNSSRYLDLHLCKIRDISLFSNHQKAPSLLGRIIKKSKLFNL